MTEADQITHLKAQLTEAHEAIRELNERASSHLITMMDAVQRLKLELDKAMAKLRDVEEKSQSDNDGGFGLPLYVPETFRDYINDPLASTQNQS